MINKNKSVLPLLPLFLVYLVLFILGRSVPGLWQLAAVIIFYAALGQAFNIFLGLTGYVDFGYVAFMGVGTYGMALTITRFSHLSNIGFGIIILGFIAALLFSTLLSLAVGAVALRLRGAYFAIATIGVNEGFRFLIEGARIWKGSEGMIFTADMNKLLGPETNSKLAVFWADIMILVIAIAAGIVTYIFIRSRIGYALTALREDEDAAKVMGINVTKFKIIAFITSACFAGLTGAAAWALKTPYVFPSEVFDIHYTIEAIIIVILGGAGTLLGPVAGSLIYGISKYYLAIYLPGYQLLIFAPVILIIIIAFPEGLIGMLKKKAAGTKIAKFII